MNRLESLELMNCQNLTVPEEVFSIGTLKHLSIDSCEQIMLSSRIRQLRDLEDLQLQRCPQVSRDDLPSDIGKLKKLKRFSLFGCPIHAVPSSILECSNLESLHLVKLRLRSFPLEIGDLINLKELIVVNVEGLRSIPRTVVKLENLETLTLKGSGDCISTLPCIPQLKSLILHRKSYVDADKAPDSRNVLHDTAWEESSALESLSVEAYCVGSNLYPILRSLPRTLRALKVTVHYLDCEEKEAAEAILNENLPQGLRTLELTSYYCNRGNHDGVYAIRKLLEKYEQQLVSIAVDLGTHNDWIQIFALSSHLTTVSY
jgi:Leucine-rich repeat (LRR) protein